MVQNPPASAGTGVWPLIPEDSACHRATEPVLHNYRSLNSCSSVQDINDTLLVNEQRKGRGLSLCFTVNSVHCNGPTGGPLMVYT